MNSGTLKDFLADRANVNTPEQREARLKELSDTLIQVVLSNGFRRRARHTLPRFHVRLRMDEEYFDVYEGALAEWYAGLSFDEREKLETIIVCWS